jgi:hypothetical protein
LDFSRKRRTWSWFTVEKSRSVSVKSYLERETQTTRVSREEVSFSLWVLVSFHCTVQSWLWFPFSLHKSDCIPRSWSYIIVSWEEHSQRKVSLTHKNHFSLLKRILSRFWSLIPIEVCN